MGIVVPYACIVMVLRRCNDLISRMYVECSYVNGSLVQFLVSCISRYPSLWYSKRRYVSLAVS